MFLGLSGISAPDIYMSGGENLYVVGRNNVCVGEIMYGDKLY